MSGMGMAYDKKYRSSRLAALRQEQRRAFPSQATGKANVSGWEQLAAMMPEVVQHGGDRLVVQ